MSSRGEALEQRALSFWTVSATYSPIHKFWPQLADDSAGFSKIPFSELFSSSDDFFELMPREQQGRVLDNDWKVHAPAA